VTSDGPLSIYRARVNDGQLRHDPQQELLAEKLQSLHRALSGYAPSTGHDGWKARFGLSRRRGDPPQGLYIYGGVGVGKSMLMDLFYVAVPVVHKRRVHFHEFLQDVHARFNAFRQNKSDDEGDPIPIVADQLAGEAWLLCFDELQISNIVDAMIVGRLFEALFNRGVVIVATSNRPPKELYKDGLQRAKFMPFINLISEKLDILALASAEDYRLKRMLDMRTYHQPADINSERALGDYFLGLTGGRAPVIEHIEIKGHFLDVPSAGDVARMRFSDLCDKPLGAADYLDLAERYHTLIIDGIPRMGENEASIARRFVTLIDALYEAKVKLICSADAPPDELYVLGEGAFEFERLVSRLMEMQSVEYLALPHGRLGKGKSDQSQ